MELKLTRKCAICPIMSSKWCANCKKVTYCCSEHQKQDRKRHKNDCYPTVIRMDEIKGRFQIATRDIQQGERIFVERPLMTGPNPGVSETEMPLCLGCCKHVKSNYKCSSCRWPVCDSICEKLPQHADFECSTFSSLKIPPLTDPVEYYYIHVFRCMLLEVIDPEKTGKIRTLEHHGELRIDNFNINSCRLLKKIFNCFEPIYKDMDSKTQTSIAILLGVLQVNAFGFSDEERHTGFSRSVMILMHKLSLISHDCTPNACWLRKKENNPIGTFTIQLSALVPIKKGEVISVRYCTDLETTIERRNVLKEGYFFDCFCKRCCDPTELGTYYSGVKCPNGGCSNGYLLPIATDMILMKCDKCGLKNIDIKNFGEREQNSYLEFDMLNSLSPSVKNLRKLEKFIADQERKLLHPNHHLMVEAKQEVVKMMGKIPNLPKEALEKQIDLCYRLLEVFDKISPGLNHQRGIMLYRLFQAKQRLLEMNYLGTQSKSMRRYSTSATTNNSNGQEFHVTQNEYKLVKELIQIGTEANQSMTWVPEGNRLLNKASKLQYKMRSLRETYSFLFSEKKLKSVSDLHAEDSDDMALIQVCDDTQRRRNLEIVCAPSTALVESTNVPGKAKDKEVWEENSLKNILEPIKMAYSKEMPKELNVDESIDNDRVDRFHCHLQNIYDSNAEAVCVETIGIGRYEISPQRHINPFEFKSTENAERSLKYNKYYVSIMLSLSFAFVMYAFYHCFYAQENQF